MYIAIVYISPVAHEVCILNIACILSIVITLHSVTAKSVQFATICLRL